MDTGYGRLQYLLSADALQSALVRTSDRNGETDLNGGTVGEGTVATVP